MDLKPPLIVAGLIGVCGTVLSLIALGVEQRAAEIEHRAADGGVPWGVLAWGIVTVVAAVLLIVVYVQESGGARRKVDTERGSMSLETAVVAPALLALLALIIVGGRVAMAHQAVESAAAEAARSASIARTQGAAASQAEASARAALANDGLQCSSTAVVVDTSGFAAPAGTPANVSATVTCVVNLAGLQVPGLGPQTITKTMTSALDTYRER